MNEAEQRELEELEDPDTWDWDKAEVVTHPARAGAVVAVRFEGEEFDRIGAAADHAGVRVPQFIRDIVLAHISQHAG